MYAARIAIAATQQAERWRDKSRVHTKSPWQIYRKNNKKAYLENTFRHKRRQLVKHCGNKAHKKNILKQPCRSGRRRGETKQKVCRMDKNIYDERSDETMARWRAGAGSTTHRFTFYCQIFTSTCHQQLIGSHLWLWISFTTSPLPRHSCAGLNCSVCASSAAVCSSVFGNKV